MLTAPATELHRGQRWMLTCRLPTACAADHCIPDQFVLPIPTRALAGLQTFSQLVVFDPSADADPSR